MKRLAYFSIIVAMLFSLFGCASQGEQQPASTPAQIEAKIEEPSQSAATETLDEEEQVEQIELSIFAAASLTEAFTQLEAIYKDKHPEVLLSFNFDSSGKLQTQIEEGAEADVFVSAALKQMDALMDGGYLEEGSRENVLLNDVVLIAAADSDSEAESFEDCATDKVSLIALGNSDVPVGQYAEEIFVNLGIWEAVSAKASLGSNVKEVLSQVESGSVDVGVVYSTDAATSSLVKVICPAPEGSHQEAAYPAAVIKGSPNSKAAGDFIEFFRSPEAIVVFEEIGFQMYS
ncbi:MAG: molybdate ABC transporter substrate-binding protein [Clostridiales bacterium]|jgi:molybdate transport system substrate-binding protein|nr:molybdate ABC transporter substrate-binding protein [Clostridiales bacterium]